MKTKILLLVFLTFCSVNLISQNASTQGIQPTYKVNLDEVNDSQPRPVKGATGIGADEVLMTNSLIAYGYVGYDPYNQLPQGPCYFDLDNPGTITSLASGTGSDFLPAGTWADGKWYGVVYLVGDLYEINPFDGSMTFIGSSGYPNNGIAYDGTTMYGCSSTMFGSIDLADGSGTIIGPMGNFGVMISIACDSSGNIYGVDNQDDNLYSINKTTGAATVIGPLGIDLDQYAQDLAFDKDNDVLYLAGYVNDDGTLYTINTSTGAATLVGDFMNGAQICAFAIPYGDSLIINDVGIVSIPSPSSGMFLTDEEPVIVLINNFGTNAQSNFDVSFIVDGGLPPVTETITATINSGETYEYTFTATIDLSSIGEYAIEVCTDLAGDENPDNNCMTKIVANTGFDYCYASTQNQNEFISWVICGSISKASSWQAGVADYTDIYTTIQEGNSEEISIINGDPYNNDSAAVWVDWNNDTIFQLNSVEEVILINDGTNEIFTGSIEVPEGTPDGNYRMRVRLVWDITPNPCGPSDYGEVEDYTIVVPPPINIDVNLLIKTQVYPNPASTVVNIKSDNLMEYVSVFNQTGQKVFYKEMNSNFYRLNTSNFLSGVYHFLIITDEGTVSRRIVIN